MFALFSQTNFTFRFLNMIATMTIWLQMVVHNISLDKQQTLWRLITLVVVNIRLTLDVFSKGFNEIEYLHWLSGYNFLWYDISEKPCWKLWDWNSTGTKKWQFYQRLYFYFETHAKLQISCNILFPAIPDQLTFM